jgi:hypothetical protein
MTTTTQQRARLAARIATLLAAETALRANGGPGGESVADMLRADRIKAAEWLTLYGNVR